MDFTTFVNPDSLRVMSNAKVEPSVLGDAPDARYQFERTGYFVKDVGDWSDERPVFNRTVTLRDSWAKVKGTQWRSIVASVFASAERRLPPRRSGRAPESVATSRSVQRWAGGNELPDDGPPHTFAPSEIWCAREWRSCD